MKCLKCLFPRILGAASLRGINYNEKVLWTKLRFHIMLINVERTELFATHINTVILMSSLPLLTHDQLSVIFICACLAVDTQRERLVARFPGAPIPPSPGTHKLVLVFQRRRALPHQSISLCVRDNCSVVELQSSPIPHQLVAEVPMITPGPHVELEIRGRHLHGLGVVSLVVLEPRPPTPAPRPHRSTPLGPNSQSPVCQKQDWTVTITELHWNDVIWPTEFQANYCAGTCPLEGEMHSNHALFRQVYNDFNGGTIPGPCCVPYAVKALKVLVLVGHILTLNQYMDAIAEACACL
jgi:hypothetical protein